MKKLLKLSLIALFGIIAFSSCRKDYQCVAEDGTVLNHCNNCRSRGVVKIAFDTDCSFSGGTVQTK